MIAKKYDVTEDPAESQLIKRLRGGDDSAWWEMFNRFDPLIYRIAQQSLPSNQVSDLIQEVHINLFRSIAKYDPSRSALVTWVMLLTRRKCIDQLRKNRRTPVYDSLEGLIIDDSKPVEIDREALEATYRGMKTLSPSQRMAFYLVYERGFTLAKTAEELQTPLGTIKTWLKRGLDTVRENVKRTYSIEE